MSKVSSIVLFLIWFFPACKPTRPTDATTSQQAARKPNVIFIIADQWRAQAMGYAGNEDVITPNFDKLAKESIRFNTAVAVMPVCTPYRASLLTGQYPLTHGVFYNDKPLPNKALTMAEIYKSVGYQTGYIGKWHLNGHKEGEPGFRARNLPVTANRRQGFDYWKVAEVTHEYNNSFYFDEKDKKYIWPGYDAFPQTDSAISYIQRKKDKPFLLVLSWGPPHDPYYSAPAKYRAMYDPKNMHLRPNVPAARRDTAKKILANYYAHCTALDKAMGDLLAALESAGIADNTILVFTSDHGDMLFSKGAIKKQRPWDESMLVPMLIRYPQAFGRQEKQINKPINTPDILPTLLGLSNIAIPNTIEGTNYAEALKGKKEYEKDAALVILPVPFHEWNFSEGGREYRAIRTEKHTYARDLKGPWLLYDNEKDPYQENNLIDNPGYVSLQASLDKLLQQKLKATNDPFLPADEHMKHWKYRYDYTDSLRPASYYRQLKNMKSNN